MHYNTKQKEAILSILKTNNEQSFSAKQLIDLLNDKVSKATLYRILDTLCEEKQIKKYYNDVLKAYEYQISLSNCHLHLHLKCYNCGKLFHLKNIVTSPLFSIDFAHSLIYGTCHACLNKNHGK